MVQLKERRAVELRIMPRIKPIMARPNAWKGKGLDLISHSQGHPIQMKTGRASRIGRVSSREESQFRSCIQMKRA
jgi:hypothetical protein